MDTNLFLIDAMSLADMAKVEVRLYDEYVTIVPGKMPALAVLDRAVDMALEMHQGEPEWAKGGDCSSKPT